MGPPPTSSRVLANALAEHMRNMPKCSELQLSEFAQQVLQQKFQAENHSEGYYRLMLEGYLIVGCSRCSHYGCEGQRFEPSRVRHNKGWSTRVDTFQR